MDSPRGQKRHKRSGSVQAAGVSPSAGARRFMKRSTVPLAYGKFQAGKVKPEKKNLDTDIVAAGATTCPSLATATPICLNLFNQGSTSSTAVGRTVTMKSLLLRLSIRAENVTSVSQVVSPTSVRVLVVYDRQPSGSLATVAQILGATTYGTASPLNLNYSDRFTVLIDEKLELSGGIQGLSIGATEFGPAKFVDRYVKIGLPSEGLPFTGAIAGLATGSLVFLAWSDLAAASSPPVIVAGMSRVRFVDS